MSRSSVPLAIPFVRVGDLAEITQGFQVKSHALSATGEFRVLHAVDLHQHKEWGDGSTRFISRQPSAQFEAAVLRPDDVLISRVGRRLNAAIYSGYGPPTIAASTLLVLRGRESNYVAAYLQTAEGLRSFEDQAKHSASSLRGDFRFSSVNLAEILIPVLPLADRNATGRAALHPLPSEEDTRCRKDELVQLKARLEEVEAQNRSLQQQVRQQFSVVEQSLRFITELVQQIGGEVASVRERLEALDLGLLRLAGELNEIKASGLAEAEREHQMARKLDLIALRLEGERQSLESYVTAARRSLTDWNHLEDFSRKLIPIAMYLLDLLKREDAPDCSPAVLQFCRAVEHELRLKVFAEYHKRFRADPRRAATLSGSLRPQGATKRFADRISSDSREYMLGEMCVNLRLTDTPAAGQEEVPLIGDFRQFVREVMKLDPTVFVPKLDELRDQYRNPAAHSGEIGVSQAEAGHALCYEIVKMLLAGYRLP